jgi:GDPmannose 4,6-dehydratase
VGLDYKDYVTQDKSLYRPAEVDQLIANPAKAQQKLGWEPKVDFEALVKMMVDADLERLSAAQK